MFVTKIHLEEISTEKAKCNLREGIVTIDVYTEH